MKVCASCPFRTGSPLAYDVDAIEALDAGYEPACHSIVGKRAIFREAPYTPPEKLCTGYLRWAAGRPGYSKPGIAKWQP